MAKCEIEGFMEKTEEEKSAVQPGVQNRGGATGSGRRTAGEGGAGIGHRVSRCCGDGKSESWSKGEDHLYEVGRRRGATKSSRAVKVKQRRIAELERLVGRQQMEIRFLDKALRQVEERRQQKNDDGGAASSKR